MEEGKEVAKNEGNKEVSLTVSPSNAEVPTSSSSSSHLDEDKKNHNSSALTCICCGCLIGIILILILLKKAVKMIGACVIWCISVCLVGILIASLTVPKLKDTLIWGLELWKWTIFVLVILWGRLISNWLIIIPYYFTKAMGLRLVSLHLVYEMKKSVRPFIWLGLILLVWVLLIHPGVERSKDTTKIPDHVTDALVGGLIVAAIWFAKSLLIKLVAFSFQHGRFLDRIKKISFNLVVIGTLLDKRSEKWKDVHGLWEKHQSPGRKNPEEDQSTLSRGREKLFALITEGRYYEIIRNRISNILVENEDGEQEDMETKRKSKVEKKAEEDAQDIIKKVAKGDSEYIYDKDLLCYLEAEDVDLLLQLFPPAGETKKIKTSELEKWMVESYKEFEPHLHALNYTRKTLGELDRLASGIAIVTGIIVWCLMMGIFTTRVLLLISTQILLASFMFGNTVKTVFEAIIFVFTMHPFDVGDQCVIDKEQMLVEEIKILYTIFRRNDMQKIFYPNSVLLTKPICNFFRNPETDDSVEFNIDISTPEEKIDNLEAKIKEYVESNPRHWLSNHSIVVKDIDNTGNFKMSLSVTHNINFQSSGEKSSRRSKLIRKLKEILEQLGVNYRLLPQEVHVKYIEGLEEMHL